MNYQEGINRKTLFITTGMRKAERMCSIGRISKVLFYYLLLIGFKKLKQICFDD